MQPRNEQQLRAVIRRFVIKWKTNLFLGMWEVNTVIRDYISRSDDNVLAECDTDWKYLRATVTFSYISLRGLDESEIEATVIHELLHIVIDELKEEQDYRNHAERVTSHLTNAMVYLDGLSKGKK
jgi:hypothetical protein